MAQARNLHKPRLYSSLRLYYLGKVQCSGLFPVTERARRSSMLTRSERRATLWLMADGAWLRGTGLPGIFSSCPGDFTGFPTVRV
jgi:hypothetical protein